MFCFLDFGLWTDMHLPQTIADRSCVTSQESGVITQRALHRCITSLTTELEASPSTLTQYKCPLSLLFSGL